MSKKEVEPCKKDGFLTSVFPARYEMLSLLGRGGGGEVWEAVDKATGLKVAIKALHTGYHSAEAEALVRETTILSGLEGLGFPRVLHLGRATDGRLFLVREMVEGTSFDEVQRAEPRRALSLLCSAANVLVVVHRAGLLHGDIKPANLIVRPDGSVALVDLGLAIALREGGQDTVGLTPHFAAPEVQGGGPLTVQAEVFSLGVILRDLLAEGADAELSESASDALCQVVVRATSGEPTERFPSVDEFSVALRAALFGDVSLPEPTGPPWPVSGWEATAYQFNKALEKLPEGGTLRVAAEPGSGTSTLFRRAAWEAALEGSHVVLIDEDVVRGNLAQTEIEAAARKGAYIFVEAELGAVEQQLTKAQGRGARVIRRVATGEEHEFEIPPLELPVIVGLFRGALPGMPEQLVEDVVERLGRYPGPLRKFALTAQGEPVATKPDLERILSGTTLEREISVEVIEACLDRGHYNQVASRLEILEEAGAHGAWLKARFHLAAGSARQALESCKEALAKTPPKKLSERALATLARAHLGLGDYTDALGALKGVEGWHPHAQAEGLAYRGLAETLLGKSDEAHHSLTLGLKCAKRAKSQRLQALVASSLATAQWRSGEHEEAASSYRDAIDAAREVGDSGMLASTQINLAGLMKERGDLAASIKLLEGAVDAARRAGRTNSLQQALLNLTNTDLYLGRLERARAQILRVGAAEDLPSALGAQLYGLRAELAARGGDVELALSEFSKCCDAWTKIGRDLDASEAVLEAVLVAGNAGADPARGSASFMPSLEMLENLLCRGRELLAGEQNALLLLAEARVDYFAGREEQAEEKACRARSVAVEGGNREWAWRAAELEALLLQAAGKRTRAARARQSAVELLEEIGARLPQDLREVYWSEPRRRALRASGRSEGAPVEVRSAPQASAAPDYSGSGTDAISRMTQTPLERCLARVLAINSDLAGEVDLARLATKIVAHACELLSAERGYLLLGTSADQLSVCASRGGQGVEHQEFSRSLAGEVLETGKPLVSVDAGRDKRLLAYQSVHLSAVSAVACVPVLSPQGMAIGALYIETRTGARPGFGDDVPTLQAFADQAAIALENSRLISALQEKTIALEERNQHLIEARVRLKEILGKRTARLREVKKELRTTKDQLASHATYAGMVGGSDKMRKIYSLIERIKDTDVPVLITGESGTGKEIAARAIYEGSKRDKGRMIAINCGAIPASILESELFGHVRGAFTGADRDRKGLFREAEGGVLFLDEIGETPLKMQASLLRVLQERKVRPVGGTIEVPVDVRVIFATNRDLQEAVAEGAFREDLLYRIQVIELALPPLRHRREDIPLLCDHFLQRFAVRFGQPKRLLSRDALALIMDHPFPGNIRQLENALLNAWILSEGDLIEAEDLELPATKRPLRQSNAPDSTAGRSEAPRALPSKGENTSGESSHLSSSKRGRSSRSSHRSSSARTQPLPKKKGTLSEHQRSERHLIVEALEATGWNRLKAAAIMKMPRRTFYRRLREYNIQ